ncbi:MAG: hypothetical protein E7435_03650 [Ruminococcaceae bacterium]|nr:hypothetical protein [Oscillospiraceae bacterium]
MEEIRAYILSVVAAAIICGSIRMLFGKKGGITALITALCGIFMTFALISPLRQLDFSVYGDYFSGFMEEAQAVVKEGEIAALQEQRAFIKRETETYILDKAVSLGADISVAVTVSETTPPTPIEITVKGAVSPYVKTVLKDYLKEQFGIPEEAQKWIENK